MLQVPMYICHFQGYLILLVNYLAYTNYTALIAVFIVSSLTCGDEFICLLLLLFFF